MTSPTHALSIRQPWADAIIYGPKRIENRTWKPTAQLLVGPFPIWIHASGCLDPVPFDACPALDEFLAGRRQLKVLSCIIGAAVVERVALGRFEIAPDQHEWWAGPLAWVLRDVVALREPVRASGRLSLWRPTPEVQAACIERLPDGWGR
jgi:hypothetical protein